MNSLGVVTRAYDAEAPYINSFIKHYFKRGVKEIHIVVPMGNKYHILKEVVSGLENVYLYADFEYPPEYQNYHFIHNFAFDKVSATHILSIDVDEFLFVDNVISYLSYDYVLFNWYIAPFPFNGIRPIGFEDRQTKYLVRKSACNKLSTHHCDVKKTLPFILQKIYLYITYIAHLMIYF